MRVVGQGNTRDIGRTEGHRALAKMVIGGEILRDLIRVYARRGSHHP